MKKIIGITLTSLALTGTAFSNAAPNVPCTSPEVVVPKFSGLKMGLGVGVASLAGRYSSVGTEEGGEGVNNRLDTGSLKFAGGPTVGYFMNMNPNWLIGAEAGVSFTRQETRIRREEDFDTVETDFRGVMTSTLYFVPQIAYVLGDSKFHLGVGWAGGKWKTKDFDSDTTYFTTNKFKSALRVAVGATQKMRKHTLGVEATYDWYGSVSGRGFVPNDLDVRNSFKPRVMSVLVKWSYDIDFL